MTRAELAKVRIVHNSIGMVLKITLLNHMIKTKTINPFVICYLVIKDAFFVDMMVVGVIGKTTVSVNYLQITSIIRVHGGSVGKYQTSEWEVWTSRIKSYKTIIIRQLMHVYVQIRLNF